MKRSDLEYQFVDRLTMASRKIRTTFNAQVVAHGLTYTRARTLFRLMRQGAMSQKELAAELELETPTVVRLLDGMEKLDLIRRMPYEGDRRANLIVLTAHGEAQAKLVADIALDLRRRMLEGIDVEAMERGMALLDLMMVNAAAICEDRSDG